MRQYSINPQQRENISLYLNILVCDPLDVTISYFLVPNLERLGPNAVQNAEETTLECVFEHFITDNGKFLKSRKSRDLSSIQAPTICFW